MDSNEQRIQKHLVVNSPGQRSEVLTERTETGRREPRLSAGAIALIAGDCHRHHWRRSITGR
jgi:hypothetical protein